MEVLNLIYLMMLIKTKKKKYDEPKPAPTKYAGEKLTLKHSGILVNLNNNETPYVQSEIP